MTPEETKSHVENRLRELGWNVHIDSAGYEKISRFTGGSEAGVSQLCHKLISLGALQERREITDDVVEMAMLDLGRSGEAVTSPSTAGAGNGGEEADWSSIEELAAQLETKLGAANGAPERHPPSRSGRGGNGGAGVATAERSATTGRPPKILLVDPARDTRARFARALANDFRVVEAADGEEAWKALVSQADIELLITDLALPKGDGYELVKRLREATSPLHLVSMPIIVIAAPENANAKMRVLMRGANDFITKSSDPSELRARVLARHKLSRAASHIAVAPSASRAAAFGAAQPPASSKARAAGSREGAKAAARAPVATLTAERRYGDAAAAARKAEVRLPNAAEQGRRRANSTMIITVGATALLTLAVISIFYFGQDLERSRIAPEIDIASQPAPSPPPEQSQEKAVVPSEDGSLPAESEPPVEPERALPPLAKATPPPRSEREEPVLQPRASSDAREAAPAPQTPQRAPPSATERLPQEAPRSETPAPAPAPAPQISRPPPPATRAAPAPAPTETPAPPPTSEPTPAPPEPSAPAPSPQRGQASDVSPNRDESALLEPPTPPPAAVQPAPPPTRISRDELSTFLTRFASVYEAGDLEQFMTLFAENARTNDRDSRSGIRRDYETLFGTTDLRQMNLGEINWEVEGNQAQGWGEFDVTVRRRGDRQPYLYTGSLTFVVEKIGGRLRIVRLYHGQRRVQS